MDLDRQLLDPGERWPLARGILHILNRKDPHSLPDIIGALSTPAQ